MTPEPGEDDRGLSRRALLLGAGFAAGAAGVAAAVVRSGGTPDEGNESDDGTESTVEGAPVAATGAHQAGVSRPEVPQSHCIVAVADVDLAALEASLAALGGRILDVTDAGAPLRDLTPDGPGDLTVTVGLGERALAGTRHPDLAAAVALPAFAGDDALSPERLGGDILISVNATDPGVLEPVLDHLAAAVDGFRLRWSEFGFRGPTDEGVTRNPFGYFDGIIVPRTRAELDADVWIADGPLSGGTICVIRQFRLDTAGFRALAPDRRDAIVGRHQQDGTPLSGGDRMDPVDLSAKSDAGELLVPAHAHARAAHPSFTGSGLMLRRSYNYRTSAADQGHLFISYQNDVQMFARTQLRLDESDDLMAFSTPAATAAFAVLPGVSHAGAALGATLFN